MHISFIFFLVSFFILNPIFLCADELSYHKIGEEYPITFVENNCIDNFENEKKDNDNLLQRLNINNTNDLINYFFESKQLGDIIKQSPEFISIKYLSGSNTSYVPYFSSIDSCQEFLHALNTKQSLEKWGNIKIGAKAKTTWKYNLSRNYSNSTSTQKLQNWLIENFPNRTNTKDDWNEKVTLKKGSNECELAYEYSYENKPNNHKEGFSVKIDMSKIKNIYGEKRSYSNKMDGRNGIIRITDTFMVDQTLIDTLARDLNNLRHQLNEIENLESELLEKKQEIKNNSADSNDTDKMMNDFEVKWQKKYAYLNLDGLSIKKRIKNKEDEYDKALDYAYRGIRGNAFSTDGNITLLVPGSDSNSIIHYVDILRGYRDICKDETTDNHQEIFQILPMFNPFPKQNKNGFIYSENGTYPIHQAVINKDTEMIQFIVDNNHSNINLCALNKNQKHIYTPIMQAMGMDKSTTLSHTHVDYDLLRTLLSLGASVNMNHCGGKSAIELAKSTKDSFLVSELKSYDKRPIEKRMQKWLVDNYIQRIDGKAFLEGNAEQCTLTYYPNGTSKKGYPFDFKKMSFGIKPPDEASAYNTYISRYDNKKEVKETDLFGATFGIEISKIDDDKYNTRIVLPADLNGVKAQQYTAILQAYSSLCSSDKNLSSSVNINHVEEMMETYKRWTYADGFKYELEKMKKEYLEIINKENLEIFQFKINSSDYDEEIGYVPNVGCVGYMQANKETLELIDGFLGNDEYVLQSSFKKDSFLKRLKDEQNATATFLFGENNEDKSLIEELEELEEVICVDDLQAKCEELKKKARYKINKAFVKYGRQLQSWKKIKKTVRVIEKLNTYKKKVNEVKGLNDKVASLIDRMITAEAIYDLYLDVQKNLDDIDNADKAMAVLRMNQGTPCWGDKYIKEMEKRQQSMSDLLKDLQEFAKISSEALYGSYFKKILFPIEMISD